MNKIKRILNAEQFIIKTAFNADTKSSVIYSITNCLANLSQLLSALILGRLVDGFADISNNKIIDKDIILLLVTYAALQLLYWIMTECYYYLSTKIESEVSYLLDVSIMRKMADVDQDFFDNPSNKDAQKAAEESSEYIPGYATTMVSYVIDVITLISSIAILFSYNWIIGLVYLLTFIPGGVLSFIQDEKNNVFAISKIPFEKEKNYYKYILTGEYYAKELRIYNLVERYKKKYNAVWDKIRHERKKIFTKGVLLTLTGTLISFAGFVFIIAFSVYSVVSGAMTVGVIVVFIGISEEAGEKLNDNLSTISIVSD